MMHIFHHWEAVATNKMVRVFKTGGLWDETGTEITKVLWRCSDCPEVKTTTLVGTWTLKDLQRPAKVP